MAVPDAVRRSGASGPDRPPPPRDGGGRPPSAPRSAARIAGEPINSRLFGPPSPVSLARSSTWPLHQEIPFYRQLADLGVELARLPLTLLLAIGGSADAPREQARDVVQHLLLPRINLVRMHAVALGQLRNRRVLPQRLQRHLRLERCIKLLA